MITTSVFKSAPASATSTPQLIKLKEAAKFLGVSQITVRRHVREGRLAHVRIKGRLYFRPLELKAYIDRHAEPSWISS